MQGEGPGVPTSSSITCLEPLRLPAAARAVPGPGPNGLLPLLPGTVQVDDLKAKLAVQELELKHKNEDADKLIQVVGIETDKVSREKMIADEEELKVQVINTVRACQAPLVPRASRQWQQQGGRPARAASPGQGEEEPGQPSPAPRPKPAPGGAEEQGLGPWLSPVHSKLPACSGTGRLRGLLPTLYVCPGAPMGPPEDGEHQAGAW